jgi:hypothetical protein
VESSITVDNDVLTCVLIGVDQISCTGMLEVGEEVLVDFDVVTANCSCEQAYTMQVEGNVAAGNGDIDTTNNYDIVTHTVSSNENCGGGSNDYDLALTKTLATDSIVAVGDEVTFTISVINQ